MRGEARGNAGTACDLAAYFATRVGRRVNIEIELTREIGGVLSFSQNSSRWPSSHATARGQRHTDDDRPISAGPPARSLMDVMATCGRCQAGKHLSVGDFPGRRFDDDCTATGGHRHDRGVFLCPGRRYRADNSGARYPHAA